jgi:hypothetical protein
MSDLVKRLRAMPSSLNDALRTMDDAAAHIEALEARTYEQGIMDADQMVGALWADLFDNNMVKSQGAWWFDKWRARIKELAPAPEQDK